MPFTEAVAHSRRRAFAVAGTAILAAAVPVAIPAAATPVAASAGWTSRVSIASNGARSTDHSVNPTMDATGRYVAFESLSPLASDDTNGESDVFLRDRLMRTTTRVSVRHDATQLSSPSGRTSSCGTG